MTFKEEIKKVMVGYEKDAHLNKKKKLTIKTTQDVNGKPRKGIKNHDWSKNIIFLLGSACIMYKRRLVYNEVAFPSYQLSTFVSKYLFGFLP